MVDLELIKKQHVTFIQQQLSELHTLNDKAILYKHPDLDRSDNDEFPCIVVEVYPEEVNRETLGRNIEDDTHNQGVEDRYRLRFTVYAKKGLGQEITYGPAPKISGTKVTARISTDLFNTYRQQEAALRTLIPESTMLMDLYSTDAEVILEEYDLVYEEYEAIQKIRDKWTAA